MADSPDIIGPPDTRVEDQTRPMEPAEVAAGGMIGSYLLLESLGEGGMGEVWLAEQKHPVRRRVAIKLIKPGMDTREVVARFESERQALALMNHPAIAKVYDAGSTPQGRPYFVMEYVNGIAITQYCDTQKLTMRRRLELFSSVCDAVQHAHQKAILHRDLKPSNILVGEVDGKPLPRIIDFGVAKAMSQSLTTGTMFTRHGAIVGTPAYMSPEQADSAGQDVDTRTDVYSLGVVLYELLVGALPNDFKKIPLDEIPRRLREQDTPRPSNRFRTIGGEAGIIAHNRRTDTPTLAKQLRGDIDAITLKALEKDRSRRYATASDLAADLRRYLRHEAVQARPASSFYRAGKYVRRHRVGVGLSALMTLLMATFVVAQAIQVRRITRERDRADRITSFMTGMFTVSDPSAARGNTVTAREILDQASKEIEIGLAKDPEMQAKMMDVMGTVYESLGLYPHAHQLLERAAEIRKRVMGPEHPDTLLSQSHLADTLQQEGQYRDAEKLYRDTLQIQRRVLGPEHADTLKSMGNLASTLLREGRYKEAEMLQRDTLQIERRVLGIEHANTLMLSSNLATTLVREGRFADAEVVQRETLDTQRRIFGTEHPSTLMSMGNLGITLQQEGHFAEAEKLFRQTVELDRRVLGPEHPSTLLMMGNLAVTLQSEGRVSEAETLQRASIEIKRRVLGPKHPDTLSSAYNLACMLALQGRRDEALGLLSHTIDQGLDPMIEASIGKDPDLNSLHGDPRFVALAAYAQRQAAARQPK